MEVRWSLPAAEDLERICRGEISRVFDEAQDYPQRNVATSLNGRQISILLSLEKIMGLQMVVSQARHLVERSAVLWFCAWAVHHPRAGWDYRLSNAAKATRWTIILVGYVLAVSLPALTARSIAEFIALAFLCWPNLAYHLTNLFIKRSIIMTQARVESVAYDGPLAELSYNFTYGSERFGGTTRVKRRPSPDGWAPGDSLEVLFDPLNPEKSKPSTLLSEVSLTLK